MMNRGSLLIEQKFFDTSALEQEYQTINSRDWRPTWEDLSYADSSWQTVPLIVKGKQTEYYSRFKSLDQIVAKFKCNVIDMMFYSLRPGGALHPHRDMVGAVGLGCLRFHVPIITNDSVDFRVAGRRIRMKPGELWALDTSYRHSVANLGEAERVHLVLDVQLNDWVRAILPKPGLKYYLHQGVLLWLAMVKALKTLTTDPKRMKANFKLAGYVGRLLLTKLGFRKQVY